MDVTQQNSDLKRRHTRQRPPGCARRTACSRIAMRRMPLNSPDFPQRRTGASARRSCSPPQASSLAPPVTSSTTSTRSSDGQQAPRNCSHRTIFRLVRSQDSGLGGCDWTGRGRRKRRRQSCCGMVPQMVSAARKPAATEWIARWVRVGSYSPRRLGVASDFGALFRGRAVLDKRPLRQPASPRRPELTLVATSKHDTLPMTRNRHPQPSDILSQRKRSHP